MTTPHVALDSLSGIATPRSSVLVHLTPRVTTSVIAALILGAAGCGPTRLDRTRAEALISAATKASPVPTTDIRLGERWQYSGSPQANWAKALVTNGMISDLALGERKLGNFDSASIFQAELTSEGQKYKVGERQEAAQLIGVGTKICRFCNVRLAEYAFGQITGIQESPNGGTAQVDFTWHYTNVTPFGDALSSLGNVAEPLDYNPRTRAASVTFTRFDDGWRLPPGWAMPTQRHSSTCELYD